MMAKKFAGWPNESRACVIARTEGTAALMK